MAIIVDVAQLFVFPCALGVIIENAQLVAAGCACEYNGKILVLAETATEDIAALGESCVRWIERNL